NQISEAVLHESSDADSAKFVKMIHELDYINLIFGLITSPDTTDELRDNALWTAGLLAASDSVDIRKDTCSAAFSEMGRIAQLLFNEGGAWKCADYACRFGQRSAAYLVYTSIQAMFDSGDGEILDILWPTNDRTRCLAKNARADYYCALSRMFERVDEVPSELVRDFLSLSNVEVGEPIIRCLSVLCERNGLIRPEMYNEAFDMFLSLFEETTGNRGEIFWAISNLLCEPGAADIFTDHWALREIVSSAASSSNSSQKKKEALWALVSCSEFRFHR
ncbi:MAG: hypothetical protein EBZ48_17190, partial [Proteobacteria bacterium]|nr:hypothetical protein [Pseudomonadota bacterium]